jgi:hypothetical protein
MRRYFPIRLLFALALLCGLAGAARANTYYVDIVGGADTNTSTQAQSKSTPWAHAPGMACATGNAASTTINAGDSIIFKGGTGETWPNACFQWNLPSSSGAQIYIGVDKTWYNGGAWARPVLTAGGSVIASGSYGTNVMITMYSNTTLDNFEITGFYWNGASGCGTTGHCYILYMNQTNGQIVSNNYFHGWTHAGTNTSTSTNIMTVIITGASGSTSQAYNNVISGTDVSGDHSVTAFYGGPGIAYQNYIQQVASAFIVSFSQSVHDNFIYDIGPAYCNVPTAGYCTHENGFEENGTQGLNFYNNVVGKVSAGLALWIGTYPSSTSNIFNNVVYNVSNGSNVLDIPAPVVYLNSTLCPLGQSSVAPTYCANTGTTNFWNNSVFCGDGITQQDCQGPVGNGSAQGFVSAAVTWKNNHTVNLDSAAGGCYTGSYQATSCTYTTNVSQTVAQASAQGYTNSQTPYVIYPTAGGSTIGAGTNLTSSATGSLAPLANDTTYGVLDVSNVVVSPARTTNARPASGAWDAGAYEYGSVVATPTFSPPSGAPPQTVTISTTTAGATILYCIDSTGTCTPGTTYTAPVTVSTNPSYVRAIGTLSGSTNSATASAEYQTVTNPPAPTPQSLLLTFTWPAQTVNIPQVNLLKPPNVLFFPPTTVTIPAHAGKITCSGCSLVNGTLTCTTCGMT